MCLKTYLMCVLTRHARNINEWMTLWNYTLWVRKNWTIFHLSITFTNTVRFFHCCRQKLSAHKCVIEFASLPIVCCRITLKNATTYSSSQKLLNKSAVHAVILLLLQSRKFWWYLLLSSLMLLHDVIMTSHWHNSVLTCLQCLLI